MRNPLDLQRVLHAPAPGSGRSPGCHSSTSRGVYPFSDQATSCYRRCFVENCVAVGAQQQQSTLMLGNPMRELMFMVLATFAALA